VGKRVDAYGLMVAGKRRHVPIHVRNQVSLGFDQRVGVSNVSK